MTDGLRHLQSAPMGVTRSWEAEVGATRVVFGQGRIRETASAVQALGCQRVFLVSDPGILAAGHLNRLEVALIEAEIQVSTFTHVDEKPTTDQVEEGFAIGSAHSPDCVVALGGGSAMDCAKGINFLLTNGGKMSDYWGFGRATHPLLPGIGIPTTAGTGSEAQSFALITDSNSHRKMACGDSSARFRAVILDPGLLSSAPPLVAAAAGLDAVSHAIESFVSTQRNPISGMLARQAWQLLEGHLDDSLTPDAPPEIRGHTLLAAHLAGAAIEQSMLGAAHACANPLTAAFGIAHGQAVALMLPHIIRFNSEVAESQYTQLALVTDLDISSGGGWALARRIEGIRHRAGLPGSLRELGVSKSEIPDLATAANLEWTARFNPRPVSQTELASLYESAY